MSARGSVALLGALLVGGCVSATVPEAERPSVARVQAWFDDLPGFSARFVEIGPADSVATGTVAFAPDGSLRLDYAPRDRNVLVARGGHIVDVDRTTGAVTTMNARATPLGLLLDGPVRLQGDGIAVTDLVVSTTRLQISLAESRNRGAGLLTLVFDAPPAPAALRLVSLETVDAERRRTEFHLADMMVGRVPATTFASPTS